MAEGMGGLIWGALGGPAHEPGRAGAVTTYFGRDRGFTALEVAAYGSADEVIGGPAGAAESGTPA
jgi:hypothetical protein